MSSSITFFLIVKSLTPGQRKELSFLLHSLAVRSGDKWHTFTVFDVAVKHDVNSDDELRKLLPAEMRGTALRHIKTRLVKRMLDFLCSEAEHPVMILRRLRNEIDLLFHVQAYHGLEDRLNQALELAHRIGRSNDALELADQMETVYSVLGVDQSKRLVPDITMSIRDDSEKGQYQNPIWRLYSESKEIRRSADATKAAVTLKDPSFAITETLSSVMQSVLIRAAMNLHYTAQNWRLLCEWMRKLIDLLEPLPQPGNEHLFSLLPRYFHDLGVYALEANITPFVTDAMEKLLQYAVKKTPAQPEWITYYYRLELAQALKRGDMKSAEQVAKGAMEKLKRAGITSESQYSSVLFSMLALSAYFNNKWQEAAHYCIQFLVRSRPTHQMKVKYYLMRCLCYYNLGASAKLGKAAKEAISAAGKNKLRPLELILFSAFGKCKISTTKADIRKTLLKELDEIEHLVKQPEYKYLEKDIQLKNWVKNLHPENP